MDNNNLQKQICPKCSMHEGIEIIYGAPKREEVERIKKGLAMPGGLRPESGPVFRWSCSNCGYVWGKI
jgi:ribosomal protein S27AE